MEAEVGPAAWNLVWYALSASTVLFVWLLFRRATGHSWLAYEPRRQVPWGFPAVGLAFFVPLLLSSLVLPNGLDSSAKITREAFLLWGWSSAAINLGFVIAASIFLSVFLGADVRDLGLPKSLRQAGCDVVGGAVGCVASWMPVYLVYAALAYVFQPEQQHPMIDHLRELNSPAIMGIGIVMAVVAAPIYEEFVFRLLLQGWLEKVETALRRRETLQPSQTILAQLPLGWLPILTSGVLFGLAHTGQGVAPLPLVIFGIVLGYLYHRTHRILPCIVAHMVFNGYTMILLCLTLK